MTIKYVQLSISITGIDAEEDSIYFLCGWLKEATQAALLGHQRDLFKFRNESDSDVEVTVVEKTLQT